MSNEVIKQLLDEMLNLQEQLAEKRQESKDLLKKSKQIADGYKLLKQEKEREEKCAFVGGIIFTIIFYLLIKFCLYYFF